PYTPLFRSPRSRHFSSRMSNNNNFPSESLPEPPQNGLMAWMPGLHTLRHYRSEWLRHDVTAGLALAAVLVPVGIAYAVAAGPAGISRLSSTVRPLLAYARFGPRGTLVVAPSSAPAGLPLPLVVPPLHGAGHGPYLSAHRFSATWFRHRVALQANSLWVHEWHSPHRAR